MNRIVSYSLLPALLVCTLLACAVLASGCGAEDASTASATPAVAADSLDLSEAELTPPDSATASRFQEAMQTARAESLHTKPVGRVMQRLGTTFMGAPYLEGTLDAPDTERLVVRLDGFDCVTYVETLLAMAQGVVQQEYSYEGFARRLARLRYRGGGPVGYCSRLHYFTDWIDDNATRGLVRPVTDTLGSRVLADTIDFMSTHRSAYDRFRTNDSLYACIQKMEAEGQARRETDPIRYVPQDSIDAVASALRAGDVLAFVTSIGGLDVSHTGLVYVGDDGRRGVLHASLNGGVVVSPDLQRYVRQIDTQIGIVGARPLRP